RLAVVVGPLHHGPGGRGEAEEQGDRKNAAFHGSAAVPRVKDKKKTVPAGPAGGDGTVLLLVERRDQGALAGGGQRIGRHPHLRHLDGQAARAERLLEETLETLGL